MKRNPRVFFSFRSPFSWLAMERLQRALPDLHETIELIPYWEPDPQTTRDLASRDVELRYTPMSKAKHLYILQDTKRIVKQLGLQMAWPVDVDPWWEPSHLGWLVARHQGFGPAFYQAVTAARWERGENISDPEVIRRLAVSVGLDGELVARAADDPEIRREGADCLAESHDDDIFGVPYFRIGWNRFWGFDRVDDFLSVLLPTLEASGVDRTGSSAEPARDRNRSSSSQAESGAGEEPLASIPQKLRDHVGAYDTDSAGGCG